MSDIAVIHLQATFETYHETVTLHDTRFELEHVACAGDLGAMVAYIEHYHAPEQNETHGRVQAIALVGVSQTLRLGTEEVVHKDATRLFSPENIAGSPITIVDGAGISDTLERWAVQLAHEENPALWGQKRVLMVPGLNHVGLAEALNQHTADMHYADPFIYFSLPTAPGIGSAETVQPAARRTLPQLRDMAYQDLFPLFDEAQERGGRLFAWADVLAGDINLILRHAPADLSHKTVVVPSLPPAALEQLKVRRAARIITLLPPLTEELGALGTHPTAVLEAVLVCRHAQKEAQPPAPGSLDETTYLNLLADVQWQPGILQLDTSPKNSIHFAFVLVPESSTELKQIFDWTSFLPDPMVERFAAYLLPHHLSHMTHLSSPATNHKVNGLLFTLGVTPSELERREPAFLQKRLVQAAALAERLGARLLGLDGLPDVIFPAVGTAAQHIALPLTTGRTLALVTTLNTAVALQNQLTPHKHQQRLLITSATSPLGQRAAAWLTQTNLPITLLANEPDRLIMLKQSLEADGANGQLISISTTAESALRQASLVVVPEPQAALNWRKCAPGAVICDLTRPFAHPPETWAARPDVVVIQATAVRPPGTPSLGYDFELFDGAIPSELAEVILLALENQTSGLSLAPVPALEEMRLMARLFVQHGFQLAAGRSYQDNITPEVVAERLALAQILRHDPDKLAVWQGLATDSPERQNQLQLGDVPPNLQTNNKPNRKRMLTATGLGAAIAAVAAGVAWWWKKRDT